MLDDFEYYRNILKKATVYAPTSSTSYTSRQVTMAVNAVISLRHHASDKELNTYLNAMLTRDPRFYDEVMEKVETVLRWSDALTRVFTGGL